MSAVVAAPTNAVWCCWTMQRLLSFNKPFSTTKTWSSSVSFVQAALGADIDVPTLDGKTSIKIPAGTQAGAVFRLKGKGIKNIQGYGHGDLHVRIDVEVPTHLSAAQKAKLQEFSDLCDGKENPRSQSFFDKAKKFFQ